MKGSQWCFNHHPDHSEERQRNASKGGKCGGRIDQALTLLLKAGRVRGVTEDTGGRPTERWFIT